VIRSRHLDRPGHGITDQSGKDADAHYQKEKRGHEHVFFPPGIGSVSE
jgi:hypothetical protein